MRNRHTHSEPRAPASSSWLRNEGERLGRGGHRLLAGGDEFFQVLDAEPDVFADPGAPDLPLTHGIGNPAGGHVEVGPLHVQMGMFGPVIVDPVVHPDFPVPAGARRTFVDGPLYDIDSEFMLVPYSIDPQWHQLNQAAGLSGEDVGLNRFDPTHFVVLGGSVADGPPDDTAWAADEVRAKVAGTGCPTLLRLLNANYSPTRMRLTTLDGTPARIAQVIAHDGRRLRHVRPDRAQHTDRQRGLLTDLLACGSAERYDVLLHPLAAGTYLIHVDWSDWRLEEDAPPVATRTVRLVAR